MGANEQKPKIQIIICMLNFFASVASQQQVDIQAALSNQQPLKLNKVGLAPNDRPACVLPPIVANKRHSISTPSGENQIDQLTLSSSANSTDRHESTTSLKSSPTEQSSIISSPLVVSLNSVKPNDKPAVGASLRKSDSSERLRQLRQLLLSNSYDAYLVTPNDEHGMEYVSTYDRRLRFISGFSGSNGYALILADRAVLFTDGRYALQADLDLDCNWWLVVGSDPLDDISNWLRVNAPRGLRVATDARLMSLQSFDLLDDQLRKMDSKFVLISQDLVDVVWNSQSGTEDVRPLPQEPIFVHPLQFAGNITWQEKVVKLADSMAQLKARHYILSQLDDIAWLLNLRGGDIPMAPLFKSYLFVSRGLESPTGYLQVPERPNNVNSLMDQMMTTRAQPVQSIQSPQVLQVQPDQTIKLTLYVDLSKITPQIRDHLNLDQNGTIIVSNQAKPGTTSRINIDLKDYNVFVMDIGDKLAPSQSGRQLQGKLLINAGANVAIHVLSKSYEDRMVLVESLVNKLKAVKSNAEVNGMRLAHWRDSLAISMLLSQLDQDIGAKGQVNKWTETSAAKELEFYRSLMDYNKGLSFDTISAYGSNAAIVHYSPGDTEPSRPIGNQSTYLLDSGGQYLDGTTDITRTMHFGEPSEFQRETYTRVLMGAIDMMSLIFDSAKYRLGDLIARRHLYELGLDYAHGTGHGIGLFSMVHEGPWLLEHYTSSASQLLANTNKQKVNGGPPVLSDPTPLQANMFTSVEPGYYKANHFGIRLENIVVTQRVDLPWALSRPNDRQEAKQSMGSEESNAERTYLRFEPISLVPFEPKLIKLELLSNKQKAWLNSYNLMVRLRMTQQINYYLAKIRDLSALTAASSSHEQTAIHVHGTSSSSRLYQGFTRNLSNSESHGSQSQWSKPVNGNYGYYNFLRLDGAKLQAKLEQTHRWIMSKTELIPLDVPQSMVATQVDQNLGHNQQTFRSSQANGELGPNSDSQRLMLVYMSSLPFNDAEAGEAVAALSDQMRANLLGERKETPISSGNSTGVTNTKNKCSGLECDLWLLSSMNSPNQQNIQIMKHQQSSDLASGFFDSPDQIDHTDSSIMDMFKLTGSSGGSNLGAAVSICSLLALSAFVVLQLALFSYLCRGGRSSKRSSSCCCLSSRTRNGASVHFQAPSRCTLRDTPISATNSVGATRLDSITASS